MLCGWELPRTEHLRLLILIPPHYPDTFHQTIVYANSGPPPTATTGKVVGTFDDGEGQQFLILCIDGTMHRPDGRLFQLTWSRDWVKILRKPVRSDRPVIITDFERLAEPISITLVPGMLR